jgi:hypothetical protein
LDQQVFGSVAAMEHSGCSGLAQALVDTASGSERVGLDAGIRALLEPSSPRVVFLYTPPEMAVANALFEGLDPVGFLEEWVSQHQLLLGYLKRHRGRWILLEAASAGLNLRGAASAIGAPLPDHQARLAAPAPMALERILAAAVLQGAADAQRIAAHLAALATPVEAAQTEPPALEDAIREYLDNQSESRVQSEFLQRLERKALRSQEEAERFREQISGLESRLAELDSQLESGRLDAEALAAERHAEMVELYQVKADAEAFASAQTHELSESQKESELLLLQLHQVQEELESWFMKAGSLEAELSGAKHALLDADARAVARDVQLGELDQAKADAEAHASSLQAQFDEVSQAKAEAVKASEGRASEITELKSENDLLLQQLHQVQEELESWYLKARGREEELKHIKQSRQTSMDEAKTRLSQARQNKEIAEKLARERHEVIQQLRLEKRQLEKTLSGLGELPITLQIVPVPPELATHSDVGPIPLGQIPQYQASTVDLVKIPVLQADANAHQTKDARSKGFAELFRSKRRIKGLNKKDLALIRKSHLFNRDWYLETNPDVAEVGFDPVEHYLAFGHSERRNPSLAFDTAFYLEQNIDVAASGKNPLIHYLKYGKAEGRTITTVKAG